ncbi:hypothetical protein PUN28_014736 [Cardiocondyla obscurior]|uniref:Uncharacterized protein n=1 Tax=Cardiocondyla obscurior TaxID=286306 RepID=A0AAW2EXQ3_9HYME
MPTGKPVRPIDNDVASAARRAVRTTLKNLKKWCARLRHRTAARGYADDQQQISTKEIQIFCGDVAMAVDQEESRNRANENLENELRESLASRRPEDDTRERQPGDECIDEKTIDQLSAEEDRRRGTSSRNEDFR